MHVPDPAPKAAPLYECPDCGRREDGEGGRCCAECGTEMRNIAVPRHR